MDSERWRRVNRLFHQTLELSPEERGGFLNQACADDLSLIDEVRDLLAAHERSGSFMDSPAGVAYEGGTYLGPHRRIAFHQWPLA